MTQEMYFIGQQIQWCYVVNYVIAFNLFSHYI